MFSQRDDKGFDYESETGDGSGEPAEKYVFYDIFTLFGRRINIITHVSVRKWQKRVVLVE